MSASRLGVYILVLAAAAAGIYQLGVELDYRRYSDDVEEELIYFPSGRFLEVASLGFQTMVSDLLWVKGIQYYGEHHCSDGSYPLAEHVFATITDLDPKFAGAYRFGAFVLAQDVGQPALGIELLRKGIRNNPELWQMPFDLGFLYFMLLKDNSKAAHYFKMASRFEDSPDIARRFTAFAYRKAGRLDVALSLWEGILFSTDNRVMRESAIYAINSIKLDQMLDLLNVTAGEFHRVEGRFPLDLYEVVAKGLLRAVPSEPFGGAYVIDPANRVVVSTTRIEEDAERAGQMLDRNIARFKQDNGVFPASLSDLEQAGLVEALPNLAGTQIRYFPATGKVEFLHEWNEEPR